MNPMEFLGEFQEEASEKLDVIANQLLRLERDAANPQPVREMFLAAHTIKGGAAMLRLTDVEALAHALEDLLSSFRDTGRVLEPTTADLLFQSIDQLRGLIASASVEAVGAEADPRMLDFAGTLRAAALGDPQHSARAATGHAEHPGPQAMDGAGHSQRAAAALRGLVVDDSATVRALHAELLERAGLAVDCFGDGESALDALSSGGYAVVVAGVQLRGIDGLELVTALRAKDAALPIVLMSVDADSEFFPRAAAVGASLVLPKSSADDEQLTEALARLVPTSASCA